MDFGEHADLSDLACYDLGVLGPKVEDENTL